MGINSSAFIRYHPPFHARNNIFIRLPPVSSTDSIYNYKPSNKDAQKYYEAYIKTRSLILQAEQMEREANRKSGEEAKELKSEAKQIKADAKAMLEKIGKLWDLAEYKTVSPMTRTPDRDKRERTETKKKKTDVKIDNTKRNIRLAPVPKVSEESRKADEIHRRALAVMDEAQCMMWESNMLVGKEARLLRKEAEELKQSAEEMIKNTSHYCLAAEEMRRLKIQECVTDVKDTKTGKKTRRTKSSKKHRISSSKD